VFFHSFPTISIDGGQREGLDVVVICERPLVDFIVIESGVFKLFEIRVTIILALGYFSDLRRGFSTLGCSECGTASVIKFTLRSNSFSSAPSGSAPFYGRSR